MPAGVGGLFNKNIFFLKIVISRKGRRKKFGLASGLKYCGG